MSTTQKDRPWLFGGRWSVYQQKGLHPADLVLGVSLPFDGFSRQFIPIPLYPHDEPSTQRAVGLAKFIAASPKMASALWLLTTCTRTDELTAAHALAVEALNEAGLGDLDGSATEKAMDIARMALDGQVYRAGIAPESEEDYRP